MLSPNDVAFNLHANEMSHDEASEELLCVGLSNAPGAALIAFCLISLIAAVVIIAKCRKIREAHSQKRYQQQKR